MPLARLLLAEAEPGDLVVGVQEVGEVLVVVVDDLAHDVARGRDAALARLEHLHRGADEVADGVDVGDGGLEPRVDEDLVLGPDLDAEDLAGHLGVGDLAEAVEDEVGLDAALALGGADDGGLDAAGAVVLEADDLGALPDLDALLLHHEDGVGAGLVVGHEAQELLAHDEDGAAPGGVEEAAVLDGRLAAADDDGGRAGLDVEVLDEGLVVEDALQVGAGRAEGLGPRAEGEDDVLGLEGAAGDLDGVVVDQAPLGVEDVLEVELLLALEVHDGVGAEAAAPKDVDDRLHRLDGLVHRREPELPREGARQHQLGRALREEVVRDAGVVRAASRRGTATSSMMSWPAAHGSEVGRAEAPGRAAAEVDGVVLAVVALVDVEDDAAVGGVLEHRVDLVAPLIDGERLVADVPGLLHGEPLCGGAGSWGAHR